ncbi:Hypothetical predicted protein [Mytilus galloprovincialis]|uniref:ZMYM2-like/QRICH1 C-terminal domain-containing protein n=1 Tax=Mytilus galloprovincialis TaxID=29158 RepID=A0A8B6C589_MYTGA|nr:Hypothetical predicted protein [Mytilus galloprovincialis]
MECRREDGSPYPPNTLMNLTNGLQRYLRENGRIHKKRADPVSIDDEKILWEKGIFSMTTSEGLSFAVFYYNCKLFGFRGMDEHRDLDASQYKILIDYTQNKRCLKFFVFRIRFRDSSVSAVCIKGGFDKYIIPTKPIHPNATEVTHLFSTGTRLYYNYYYISNM